MTQEWTDVGAVIAAAGRGVRFGGGNKLLHMLRGRPVVCHCVQMFVTVMQPENIVVVVPAWDEQVFRKAFDSCALPAGVKICAGGRERQHSVLAGLNHLPQGVAVVAIHDAARPFTSVDLLARCVESARRRGSGVAARRVTDTIKIVTSDGAVVQTPERGRLRAAETPQVFRRAEIECAYAKLELSGEHVTDDAQVLELAGGPVFLVEHDENNRKITFAGDVNE